MKLIVGLGNPGDKYINTRHNLGFMVLDTLLKEVEPLKKTFWEDDSKKKVQTKEITLGKKPVTLARPLTFMNNSGYAVAHLINYYKIDPSEMAVVYDDLDLPFGRIRVRFGGAAGGHKGVESLIRELKTDKFLRIRLGIGHPNREHDGKHSDGKSHLAVEDYVLQPFNAAEKSKVRHMSKEAIKNISLVVEHGIDLYMSKYNGEEVSEKT